MRLLALTITILFAHTALADTPVATGVQPDQREPTEPRRAPIPVEKPAPLPDQASGVAREDAPPKTDRFLWIPRALLFVPRIALWVAAQPVRGAAYAYERYDVPTKVTDATFNDKRTFGVYPTATYQSDFGFTIGGRLLYRNLFDNDDRLKLRVDFGGRYKQAYGINLRSGRRFGDTVSIEFDSSYERRPQERFYGIGNPQELDEPVDMPLDPSLAFATRFREDLVRNVLTFDAKLVENFHARLSGALMLREFAGTDEDDSLTRHYEASRLVGWERGVDNIYLEQELVYDSRRPSSPYQSKILDATGWYASIHAGMTTGVRDDPSEHFTYGGEVQRYFDLYDGSRVLALRVLAEAVHGDSISFIDLPRLGGVEHLRGYPNGRFRDRAVTLGSAEYTWDLGNYLAAYTFADVGRPFSSLAAIEAEGLRVGFGGGVQLHSRDSFWTRLQVAASRDGDFFIELAFAPAFGRRERAGRF